MNGTGGILLFDMVTELMTVGWISTKEVVSHRVWFLCPDGRLSLLARRNSTWSYCQSVPIQTYVMLVLPFVDFSPSLEFSRAKQARLETTTTNETTRVNEGEVVAQKQLKNQQNQKDEDKKINGHFFFDRCFLFN